MAAQHGRPSMNKSRGKAAVSQDIEVLDLTGDDDPQPLPSKPGRPQNVERPVRSQPDVSVAKTSQKTRNHERHHDLPGQPSSSDVPRKRKAPQQPTDPKPSPKRHKADEPPEEKRLKRWRPHPPPQSYAEIRGRALTQRMFVVDRRRTVSTDQTHPVETATIVGTTGNVYTVVVSKVPSCDCPHARKGNQCKHIVYVLSRVLRAPPRLEYQLAFTSGELVRIFDQAPPLPSETVETGPRDGNRKAVEGECPICCDEFEQEEQIVWCRAACGNNVHGLCFDRWAASGMGQAVTCPFCRSPWQAEEPDVKAAVARGQRNAEGYVNVAGAFGLSGRRDYSSYHDRWVERQMRDGLVDDEGYGYDDHNDRNGMYDAWGD